MAGNMRYANKAEVMHALERGAHIESHDLRQWIVKANGDTAGVRYSLWRILTKGHGIIERVRTERRPPSVLPFTIYKLREAPK